MSSFGKKHKLLKLPPFEKRRKLIMHFEPTVFCEDTIKLLHLKLECKNL